MKNIKSFELFELESADLKPEIAPDLKSLKKLMRKASSDRSSDIHLYGEFSNRMESHRGQFMFIENADFWDQNGEMTYTGSGKPDSYIAAVNKKFFNPLGWEMVEIGQRSVKVQKLNVVKESNSSQPIVKFQKWICIVEFLQYRNDRTAIQLIDKHNGEIILVASVNIPDERIADDEVIIKDYAENKGILDILVEAGIIGPSLRKVETGYVEVDVCKLLTPEGRILADYEKSV